MNVYMPGIRYICTVIFQKRFTRRFSIPCSSVKVAEKNFSGLGRESRRREIRQAHRECISTKTLSEQKASPRFFRPIGASTAGVSLMKRIADRHQDRHLRSSQGLIQFQRRRFAKRFHRVVIEN